VFEPPDVSRKRPGRDKREMPGVLRANGREEIVVIGGGICGLQIAALLAHDRRKVTVFEAHREVGGRARVTERDGFSLDFGIHLVRSGQRGPLAKTFRSIGRPVRFEYIRTSYLVDEDGKAKRFPTHPLDLSRPPRFLGGRDAIEALLLLPRIRSLVRSRLEERTSLMDWCIRQNIPGSLFRYLAVLASATLVNADMATVPAAFMFDTLRRLLRAGLPPAYPAGGWKRLFEELLGAIEKGGRVQTSARVQRLLVRGGRAHGVVVNNKIVPADVVVCALPVQNLFSVLSPDDVPEPFYALCTNLRPTAGISIDYCLDRPIHKERALWFFWEPRMLTLFTSNLEPSLAPHGRQIYTAFSPLKPEEISDRKRCKIHQARMEQALSLQWPALERAALHKRVLILPMVDGAEVSVQQLPRERPGPTVPGIENLFLVGDSLKAPGGGGDIGHESVHITYQAVTDYLASRSPAERA